MTVDDPLEKALQLHRLLCASSMEEEIGGRHCEKPQERNVFSRAHVENELNLEDNSSSEENVEEALLPACVSDEDGNFGSSEDTANSSTILVTYEYEVQTTLALGATALNQEVLPDLEKALSDWLLPELLEGIQCLSQERRTLQEEIDPTPLEISELVGLQSAPADALLPGRAGIDCEGDLADDADRCFVVNGGFTLLGRHNIDWARPLALILTRDAMDMGSFDNGSVHEDVVQVRFVKSVAPPQEEPAVVRGTIDASSDDRLPGYAIALIVTGLIALLVSAVYFVKRRRKQQESERLLLQSPTAEEAGTIGSTSVAYFDPDADHIHQTWAIGESPPEPSEEPSPFHWEDDRFVAPEQQQERDLLLATPSTEDERDLLLHEDEPSVATGESSAASTSAAQFSPSNNAADASSPRRDLV